MVYVWWIGRIIFLICYVKLYGLCFCRVCFESVINFYWNFKFVNIFYVLIFLSLWVNGVDFGSDIYVYFEF